MIRVCILETSLWLQRGEQGGFWSVVRLQCWTRWTVAKGWKREGNRED